MPAPMRPPPGLRTPLPHRPTPMAETPTPTGLPSKPYDPLPSKPPMFAYARLPSKPTNTTTIPPPAMLPPRPANDDGNAKGKAKASSPPMPRVAMRSPSGTPAPGPGAMVPYSPYAPSSSALPPPDTNIPGVAGRADISVWSKPFKPGEDERERTRERDDETARRKRARSEDEDGPSTPLSLAVTRTVLDVTRYAPDEAVPVLPPPLPSKRAKKGGASTALLLPVEALPVFPLPPLPPITDDTILKSVFTHHSVFPRSRGHFEEPDCHGHYEKLEHVGDSILGMVVTTWLHELKPGLTCGTATKLKAHLVSNATLSHISGMYNLPQRLNGDPRLLPVLRAQTDVRAALVEAYIAGVYFSFPADTRLTDGMACITSWLREMYDPLYDFFFQHMRNEYHQHYSVIGTAYDGAVQVAASPEELDRLDAMAEGMALLVRMYGTSNERKIEYDSERFETSVGILWRMRCSVDGIEMGDATRSSRYRARNAAAWEAARKLGLVSYGKLSKLTHETVSA